MMDPWAIIGWLILGGLGCLLGAAAITVLLYLLGYSARRRQSRKGIAEYLALLPEGKVDWAVADERHGTIYTTTVVDGESGPYIFVRYMGGSFTKSLDEFGPWARSKVLVRR